MVKFPSSCELSMNINSLHSPPYLSRKKKNSKKLKELVNGKLSLQKRGKKTLYAYACDKTPCYKVNY